MSLAGHGPKSRSSQVCLIISKTGQQGPVLYKVDKGVSNVARLSEGGQTESGAFLASSLPGMDCLSILQLTHPKVVLPKKETA